MKFIKATAATAFFASAFFASLGLGLCTPSAHAQASASASASALIPASGQASACVVAGLAEPKAAPLPAAERAALPRGARSIFCLSARLEGRRVLLHAWNAAKAKDTTLDVLAVANVAAMPSLDAGPSSCARRKTSRSRSRARSKSRSSRRPARLARISLPRIEYEIYTFVQTAALDARAGRGSVLVVDWQVESVSLSYSSSSQVVVTLPAGLGGRAVVQSYDGESEPTGGNSFEPEIAPDGRFRLSKHVWTDDTESYTPCDWDGSTYKAGVPGQEKPRRQG